MSLLFLSWLLFSVSKIFQTCLIQLLIRTLFSASEEKVLNVFLDHSTSFLITQQPFFHSGQYKPHQTRLIVQALDVLVNFVFQVSGELFYYLTQLPFLRQRWYFQSSGGCPNLSTHFRGNICILTMHRNVCLCYTIQSLTQVCFINGPFWLPFPVFVKFYYISYGFETVLATCTRIQKICILLYRWEKGWTLIPNKPSTLSSLRYNSIRMFYFC